jgi:hypothetical protein
MFIFLGQALLSVGSLSLQPAHLVASPSLSFFSFHRTHPPSTRFPRQGNARTPPAPVPLSAPLVHPPHAVRELHHPNAEASGPDHAVSCHSKHRRRVVPSLDVDFASHLRARVPDRLPAPTSRSEPPRPPRRREIAFALASASPMPRRATEPHRRSSPNFPAHDVTPRRSLVRAHHAVLSY